jgi:hypothetical protein
MIERLTRKQFEDKLAETNPVIIKKHWNNYPNSTFYYDQDPDNVNHQIPTIGIYTSETAYGFGDC